MQCCQPVSCMPAKSAQQPAARRWLVNESIQKSSVSLCRTRAPHSSAPSLHGGSFSYKVPSAVSVAADPISSITTSDPALESLIDRWLSNRQASTSAAQPTSNGNSSRLSTASSRTRRSTSSLQQPKPASAAAEDTRQSAAWEMVLSSVSATLDSLSSIDDETDELMLLSDALDQLAGGLQELQSIALHLQQQQQQLPAVQNLQPITATAVDLSSQLQQLLVISAKQVTALPDAALLNLLAVAVVVLAPSAQTSSSSRMRIANREAAAAAAAARAALSELAQRPEVAADLDSSQLTSLSVVLYRLGKQLGLAAAVPRTVILSMYQRLQDQIQVCTASRLIVVFWCLGALGVPPRPSLLTAVLQAATEAVADGQLEDLSIRRLSAVLIRLHPYLAAAGSSSSSGGEGTSAAAAAEPRHLNKAYIALTNLLSAASEHVVECCSSTSSSAGAEDKKTSVAAAAAAADSKLLLAVAQLCSCYGHEIQHDQLTTVAAEQLLASAASAAGEDGSSLCEAAAAAGYMLPYWHNALSPEQQQQVVSAVMGTMHAEQQQAVGSDDVLHWSVIRAFLAAACESCKAAAAAGGGGYHSAAVSALDLCAQQLLQQQQQLPPTDQSFLHCSIQLVHTYTYVDSKQSQQLHGLCTVAAAAVAAAADSRAAADLAAAISQLRLDGWQQQVDALQAAALSDERMRQLPIRSLLQLSALSGAVGDAALQQLVQCNSSTADTLTVDTAVDLLTIMTQQLHLQTQQQQQQQEEGAVARHPAAAAAEGTVSDTQQQCLLCLDVIQRSSRDILPEHIVPLLTLLLQMQQNIQQQFNTQQQQYQQQYQRLHREVLAAVALQLEDSVRYLLPQQISDSVKLLAQLHTSSSSSSSSLQLLGLALSAVVSTVAGRLQQYSLNQLTWVLWGLTKLKYNKRKGFNSILKHAVNVATAAGDKAAVHDQQHRQQQQQQDASQAGSAVVDVSIEQLAAVLWAAAHKFYTNRDLSPLLQMILSHSSEPQQAQVASVLWSYTRLRQAGAFRQQQQQLLHLLQWVERWLTDRAAAAAGGGGDTASCDLSMSTIVNIIWAFNKLGHIPTAATQQLLLTAALQQQQQQLKPAEISCLIYCISRWSTGSSSSSSVGITQQQRQQLQQQLEQQLFTQLSAVLHSTVVDAAVVDVDGRVKLLAAASAGNSSSSSNARWSTAVYWDGPSVCSCCNGLAKLGIQLQAETLAVAEQYIMRLLPAAAVVEDDNARAAMHDNAQQQLGWLAPASAADLALFADACRRCSYQPTELLQRFRSWFLLRYAKKGPGALMQLIGVTARRNAAAAAKASMAAAMHGAGSSRVGSGAVSPTGSSSSSSPSGAASPKATSSSSMDSSSNAAQLLRALRIEARRQQQQRCFHANAITGVLLFLRHLQCRDQALLQQLEILISNRPISMQLTGQQLVMAMSAFWQLGFYPTHWWSHGLRRLLLRHVDQLGVRESVELLQVLSGWKVTLLNDTGSKTYLNQYLLPRIIRRLLGDLYSPKRPLPELAAAAAAAAAVGSPSASLASITVSTTDDGETVSSSSSGGDGSAVDANKQQTVARATKSADGSSSSSGDMISRLSGPQIVSLLRSMVYLNLGDVSNKYFSGRQLTRQVLRRLQQVWQQLPAAAAVAAAHAAGQLKYDVTSMLDMQLLLPQLIQQRPQAADDNASSSSSSSSGVLLPSASLAANLLWVFANAGKQPPAVVLDLSLQTVAAAAAGSDSSSSNRQHQLPLREISNILYAAAVLREQQHPAAVALVQRLAAAAAADDLMSHPEFGQQQQQLAACFLTSQILPPRPQPTAAAAGSAAADSSPSTAASSGGSGSGDNPWLNLPADVQQRLLQSWRRSILIRSGSRLHQQQQELLACCRALGMKCRGNAVTTDGVVCVDVAATTDQGDLVALELLGPHNAARNTQKPLGPARIKWRLLAARGYRVVIINCWQWSELNRAAARLSSSSLSSPSYLSRGSVSESSAGSSPAGGGDSGVMSNRGQISHPSDKSVTGSEMSDGDEYDEFDDVRLREKVVYLKRQLLAAGVRQQQQRQQQVGGAGNDQESRGTAASSSSMDSSALQRPVRRPGAWR